MDIPAATRMVVVDTDAGADDALALFAVLGAAVGYSAAVHLLAITCVHGNTGVRNVTRNVLATLRVAGRLDVPVFRGAESALVYTPATDGYFGSDGLGDFLPTQLQDDDLVQKEHAASALIRLAASHPGRVTLLCLGPLTNIALAARLDPHFLDNLADVFVLGGSARGLGNTKASTEFNVFMDAEAFQAVLTSVTKPVYLLPWETVINLNMSEAWRYDVLGSLGSPQVDFLNKAERNTVGRRKDLYAPADGLLAIAFIQPDVIRLRTTTRMEVVLGDGSARGVTLVDYMNKNPGPRNVVLLEDADKLLVEQLLLKLLTVPTNT